MEADNGTPEHQEAAHGRCPLPGTAQNSSCPWGSAAEDLSKGWLPWKPHLPSGKGEGRLRSRRCLGLRWVSAHIEQFCVLDPRVAVDTRAHLRTDQNPAP